jgi:hypothetical protein
MALLELGIEPRERESEKTTSKDIAFFMPGVLDASGIGDLRRGIVKYSQMIRECYRSGNTFWRVIQGQLEEDLLSLEGLIRSNADGMLVLAARGPIGASEEYCRNLAKAYGDDNGQSDRCQYFVPLASITAARALPYASAEGMPQPILALRIQTGAELPTSYYAGPGETAEVESPGAWFQFKLADINMGLYG